MITNARPMACGNCGHGLFRMFYTEPTRSSLLAECDKCKSISTLSASTPHLEIGWGEDAEGIFVSYGAEITMTKIKTAELTGAALDWAVATCEGHSLPPFPGRAFYPGQAKECWINVSPSGHDVFAPSTDWSQAGPIIEREGIQLWTPRVGSSYLPMALINYEDGKSITMQGPTILIAAMRCFVASKLGDEVEVPEELVTS